MRSKRKNASPVHSVTDEALIYAVNESTSIAGVGRVLGLKLSGSSFTLLKQRIIDLGLYEKFRDSRYWNRGKTRLSDFRIAGGYNYDSVFTENSTVSSSLVRKLLVAEQLLEYKCACCGINEWNNEKLTLELDHINGVNTDNSIKNLRFLCPNCHSQTMTWRGRNKNRGKKKVTDAELIAALKEESSIRKALLRVGLSSKGGNYERCRRLLDKNTV